MSKSISTAPEADNPLDLEEELQARVAWHYYVGNLTQQEIAERIGSNRARVNRLLAASRESGLVQVTINSRIAPCVALEEALMKRYGLERAIVVPEGVDRDTTQAALGIGAANFLSKELRAGQTVGLGWGRTIRATLRAMPHRSYGPLAVVSLQGGLPHCPSINTFDIVSDFADLCQADGFLFAAPIYVSSQKARDIILQEDAVRETYERARHADLAVLTCGDLTESLVVTYGISSPEQRRAIEAAGAVGDMLGHFMDEYGEPIDHPLNRRTVAVSLADLRSIQRVVLVSGGEQKYDATRAALRGGYPSVLVTDERTAQRLCAEPEASAAVAAGAKHGRRTR
ncbi:sugar-binding transcriptional regulator [Paraburkholderia caballeronis]|uniref:DNA-binding transcriptional regulator LsrR, DeoR family n=1 Tax=Paraburkholderia caballeronis TaxID=416943 RepID=A0A1H7S501_9BURK|nr:sugar-binding transcriptional regulator [Paraburkholderia caballeronis]PXW22850.1 DNA-binding transcriptional regulator LsrR (DeoR family) [Paraburkholderia caballeronis]PXW97235.1 DNA-binding transcriptional regulator LsrR (DeoR family) [Paraburkholderia caballeronis]RAJ93755.1 DNA-binding transcriptional regulator LsrR (DeoR family) [Paraburkholderia caballeronis]SED60273.1 DNA-binding transcriptional regulator LsrR, DeoR family [Paraburkholderia caballeronis]SEL66804.1 DNA-binding transc